MSDPVPYLADMMLQKLARWLRLAGQDVACPDGDDLALMRRAKEEGRVLLTRDKALAARCVKGGVACILIGSSDLEGQLYEMMGHGLSLRLDPQRCTICNGPLERDGDVWRCHSCGKLYWEGSHWARIKERMERVENRKG